jgi:hypothetical protein
VVDIRSKDALFLPYKQALKNNSFLLLYWRHQSLHLLLWLGLHFKLNTLYNIKIVVYDLELSRRLCIIKSSRAISRVKWFKHEETNVSRSNPEDEDGDGPRNVGLLMCKPLDAAESPRRFY